MPDSTFCSGFCIEMGIVIASLKWKIQSHEELACRHGHLIWLKQNNILYFYLKPGTNKLTLKAGQIESVN